MKVLVVGANGQIGRHLVRILNESGTHLPRAMVRRTEQADRLEESGVETVVADLEGSVDELAKAAGGCDAVVFTAGSGGGTGEDKTLLIDLDGAVKTMEAAEKAGIKRFILISAIGADQRETWNKWEGLKPYLVAKRYADKMLEQSNLTYTIIRPGTLLNKPGNGMVTVAADVAGGSIAREDVAKAIVASLNEKHTLCRAFDLVSGEQPITDALKKF